MRRTTAATRRVLCMTTLGISPHTRAGRSTYDAENRQTDATPTLGHDLAYFYDGEGRRVKKRCCKRLNDDVRLRRAGEARGGVQRGCSPQRAAGCFLTADHLGSTRLVTNAGGGVVERTDYLAFGDEIVSSTGSPRLSVTGYTADSGIQQKFTGKERDAETGLDYFGARYFSAAQGRFTNPDPLVWQSWQSGNDDEKARFLEFISDPQNFNQYAYVRNNPLSSIDPSGLYTCSGTEEQCRNLEAQLVEARKSNDSKVSRAAGAYGAAGVDNGVGVSFSDEQASGHGTTGFVTVVNGKTGESSNRIDVVLSAGQFSGGAAATSVTAGAVVVHEGSHVGDDQAYLFTAAAFPGLPNSANITHLQSEVQAFLTGAAFMAEHGRVQGSAVLPGVRLDTVGTIGVFLNVAPSNRPPFRAYPASVLRSPIY